jgi:excisionase family DNA binding protein
MKAQAATSRTQLANRTDSKAPNPPRGLDTRAALSMSDAADALGISRAYAYRLRDSGELKTFTLGRRRLVSVDEVRALIRKREGVA